MEAAFIGATYTLITMLGTALFVLLRAHRKLGLAFDKLVSTLEMDSERFRSLSVLTHEEAQGVRDART